MNAHSCHYTKVRVRGGKGSSTPTAATLHPCLFMQWVFFLCFFFVFNIYV